MNFMNFSEFGKSLESHYQNIRDLTTEIVGSESDDNIVPPELEICTEQEFKGVQIRNAILLYLEIKGVSPIKLNKETNPLTLNVVSQNNSLPKLKTPSQIENDVLLTNQTLNIKIKESLLSLRQNRHQSHHQLTRYLPFNSREM